MKKLLLAAAMTLALAGPAFASQCPALMAKIDAAIKTATVDEATKAKVMELYTKGKAEHEGGSHAASEATLGEAMKLLGI
jgi:opacity protein-like surface antigen